MDTSRRDLFGQMSLLGALGLLLSERSAAQSTPLEPGEVRTADYYKGFYDGSTRGAKESDLKVLFHDDKHGFRYKEDIKDEELSTSPGDVTVDVVLDQFHASDDDKKTIKGYDSAQVRVDCAQTSRFMNLFPPAAWIALASLYPDKAGKLPSLQQLGFSGEPAMSGDNKIVLPGGRGKFSINVSSMAKESALHKVFRQGIAIGQKVAPLIPLPSISIPAAIAFTEVYSVLEEKASFIMSSKPIAAVATSNAAKDADVPDEYLPVMTGNYIFIPKRHEDKLAAKLAGLDLKSGYLVEKSASTNVSAATRADSITDVTYLTLKVSVNPLNTGIPSIGGTGNNNQSGRSQGTNPGSNNSGNSNNSNSGKPPKKN
jgi:hypothetical protein